MGKERDGQKRIYALEETSLTFQPHCRCAIVGAMRRFFFESFMRVFAHMKLAGISIHAGLRCRSVDTRAYLVCVGLVRLCGCSIVTVRSSRRNPHILYPIAIRQ
jgi:hypothetical protein